MIRLSIIHYFCSQYCKCCNLIFFSSSTFKGKRYEPINLENAYKVIMRLTINSVTQNDFGSYRCVSKNSLGDTDGSIKLYREYKNDSKQYSTISSLSFYYYNILFDHYRNAFAYGFLEISFASFDCLWEEKKRDKIPFHLAMELVYLQLNLLEGRIVGMWSREEGVNCGSINKIFFGLLKIYFWWY